MAQVLNGKSANNDGDSFSYDVGIWRHAVGNWNFTDDTGATGAYTLFTVTGDVMVRCFGLCQVTLTSGGAPTIEVGIAGNTAAIIAQTAGLDLDQYETWQDNGPEANPGDVATAMAKNFAIANGADIILTVGAAALTAGDVDFHCFWAPLSPDGSVAAA